MFFKDVIVNIRNFSIRKELIISDNNMNSWSSGMKTASLDQSFVFVPICFCAFFPFFGHVLPSRSRGQLSWVELSWVDFIRLVVFQAYLLTIIISNYVGSHFLHCSYNCIRFSILLKSVEKVLYFRQKSFISFLWPDLFGIHRFPRSLVLEITNRGIPCFNISGP